MELKLEAALSDSRLTTNILVGVGFLGDILRRPKLLSFLFLFKRDELGGLYDGRFSRDRDLGSVFSGK